jgi:SAM-dependent methyltransferase
LLYAPHVRSIEAVDFASEMVSIFERHISEEGLDEVKVQVADGQALPFADATFDRAVSMFGLMFFPDRMQGIREIVRCLKPGGRALISSWAEVDQSPLIQVLFAAGRAANPDMPPPQKDWQSWENSDLLRDEMQKGGLVDVVVREVSCTHNYSSGGEFWDQMVEGGVPFVLARQRMGAEAWEKYSRTCREYLERELADKAALGSTAYLAYGTRPG